MMGKNFDHDSTFFCDQNDNLDYNEMMLDFDHNGSLEQICLNGLDQDDKLDTFDGDLDETLDQDYNNFGHDQDDNLDHNGFEGGSYGHHNSLDYDQDSSLDLDNILDQLGSLRHIDRLRSIVDLGHLVD